MTNPTSIESAKYIRRPGGQEVTCWEFVGPDTAAAYLERNSKSNRKKVGLVAERYATDMRSGDWVITHEGAAFDEDDFLVDAQHRLEAVVRSGVGIWMLVTRNLSRKSLGSINRGAARTIAHSLQIMGIGADLRTVAVVKAMAIGPVNDSRAMTDAQIRDFLEAHMEAILFAMSICKRKTGPATVCAAIARAYYSVDGGELTRFCEAMADDDSKDAAPEDRTARKLKAVVIASKNMGGTNRVAIYRKTQAALKAYIEGRVLKNLCEVTEDLFPLPAEPAK